MIVKEDLIPWFMSLQSYRRIDIMCSLLNVCLPFELRFLGTFLENLGRRDAQKLRGAELRINNPSEFIADLSLMLTGHPAETKFRRQMALYLALLRVCNRTGVNELYKILDQWGELDFSKFEDGSQQEFLLIYTMATNHPVFSFEQRLRCGEIYTKIIQSKPGLSQQSPVTTSPIPTPLCSSNLIHHQHQIQTSSPPPPQTQSYTFQPPLPSHTTIINTQPNQQIPNRVPIYPTATMTQIITTGDPTISMGVDRPPQIIQSMPIQTDFTAPVPQQWPIRFSSVYIPPPMDNQQFPPQATSPHLSQPSSPAHSRTGSPSRQNQVSSQQSIRSNRPLRSARPSTESTPPPPHQQQLQPGTNTVYMSNDTKNFEDINLEATNTQLHSLNLRNGFNRPSTISRQHKSHHHDHPHGHYHPPNAGVWNSTIAATLQQPPPAFTALPIVEMKKTSTIPQSESGGSSSNGEASPPTVPELTIHNQSQSRGKQQSNLSRLNGGIATSIVSNNNNVDFNGTPVISMIPVGQIIANNFQTAPPNSVYRQPSQNQTRQFQQNGDVLTYQYPAPTFLPAPGQIVVSQLVSPAANPIPTPYPTSNMIQSCFNCGSTTHIGLNCSEASMEEVTRNSVYKLDYTITSPPPPPQAGVPSSHIPTTPMTSSVSSTNSLNNQPAQLENDQTIPIIDLTQDTSSNSSSSSTSSIHAAK